MNMEIQELEHAFRALFGNNSRQLALAALASNGQVTSGVPQEFANAARTLLERQASRKGTGVLHSAAQLWA